MSEETKVEETTEESTEEESTEETTEEESTEEESETEEVEQPVTPVVTSYATPVKKKSSFNEDEFDALFTDAKAPSKFDDEDNDLPF